MPREHKLQVVACGLGALIVVVMLWPLRAQEQLADATFDVRVAVPAYERNGPTVAIDRAHRNFHTADGRYKPFADLLSNDGYRVMAYNNTFDAGTLKGVDILVIANAGVPVGNDLSMPAFSAAECDAVRDWVRTGGSLLLISDHAPFGAAAAPLAQRFGVVMGQGWAYDHSDSEPGITTQLLFSRGNGLLGDHPILHGRGPQEEVTRVKTFTGQSISIPPGATALLRLSETAAEASTPADLEAADAARRGPAANTASVRASSAAGRAQGIAMIFGRGRLVVVGEAAMFSAQVVRFSTGNEQREMKMGMNVPDSDDRQFALNVVHWLSRLLK